MRSKERILEVLTKHGTEAVDRALVVELLADIRDEIIKFRALLYLTKEVKHE